MKLTTHQRYRTRAQNQCRDALGSSNLIKVSSQPPTHPRPARRRTILRFNMIRRGSHVAQQASLARRTLTTYPLIYKNRR